MIYYRNVRYWLNDTRDFKRTSSRQFSYAFESDKYLILLKDAKDFKTAKAEVEKLIDQMLDKSNN